jgi:hypothetical protein
MDKMAIFVEGQTEQCFTEQLLNEIAGRHNVHIDTIQAFGGSAHARSFRAIEASRPHPQKNYYVLICDCSNDSRVLSDVRDEYSSLTAQGYREIVGIRDVYPLSPSTIPTIRSDFIALTPQTPVQPLLVLAVMEIEAWFLAEHTHFIRLHSGLTLAAVRTELGYDPSTHDVQLVPNPAADLRKGYNLVGLGYNKSRAHVQRTLNVLDFILYYMVLPVRIPDLKALVDCIDRFLS